MNFKFSLDEAVNTPRGPGRVCDQYDTRPTFSYRVVMDNVEPVKILKFYENELEAIGKPAIDGVLAEKNNYINNTGDSGSGDETISGHLLLALLLIPIFCILGIAVYAFFG